MVKSLEITCKSHCIQFQSSCQQTYPNQIFIDYFLFYQSLKVFQLIFQTFTLIGKQEISAATKSRLEL